MELMEVEDRTTQGRFTAWQSQTEGRTIYRVYPRGWPSDMKTYNESEFWERFKRVDLD